ncbi:hypothetical protein EYF80_033378 [Liparis tanakae]|uniref:Uncharacterized protein n=1 Tax=Liparis tanakae TaxID=230148 RepID=A0A4Z2GS64_9TELE|nr:hypothetical protein EYF80_033378 [Liparis tanakae]
MGAKAQRCSMDSGSWGADKAPFRGPRPGDNGWARLSPLLHSSTQRLILQMGFPGPGKIKQVVWAWQESWLGPGWAGLQAAGGYQKLLGPALGQRSEWPRASLSCEFWELPRAPSNTSELPIWRSLGN